MRRLAVGAVALMMLGALGACSPRSSEWTDEEYRIAAGGSNGIYYAYGSQLADQLSDRLDVTVVADQTAGSVDNLLRVSSGRALLGFAQGDAAADAATGVGAFDQPLPVLAVARLYDEYVHVVVRADSDIESLQDLTGRTMSLGAENSGVHVIAERVLDAAEVELSSIQDPRLDLNSSIHAMEQGEIDGFFWVGGIPTPGIAELAEALPLRLLPIESSWVSAVNERYSHSYRTSDFPAGLYGLAETEQTMAVPNYLVTSADTPDEIVRDVLERFFEARTDIAEVVPAAALLDRRQAIFTSPMALHPGAIEFYRDLRD